MKKICPACKTLNDAIGFKLSEKELLNLSKLGLSEHLCQTCYSEKLQALKNQVHNELIPLNEQKEITQAAYYQAYEAWKAKAALFQAIDYNVNLIKFETKKKETSVSGRKPRETLSTELLAKKILAGLSLEQQEAIIQSFKTLNNA